MTSLYSTKFFATIQSGSRSSAQEIVPIVLDLAEIKSVCDLGCGTGCWLKVFMDHGVGEVLGIDGEYVDTEYLEIPEDRFMSCDLEKAIKLDRRFDLVVSLEVAEHLPASCARGFVRTLVGLGPLILFSAAIPLQGGTGHVNEQWQDYWTKLFHECNYVPIDCIRRKVWNNDNVEMWFKQNTLIYCDKNVLNDYPELLCEKTKNPDGMISVVHPDQYLVIAKRKDFSIQHDVVLSEMLKAFPIILWRSITSRVRRLVTK